MFDTTTTNVKGDDPKLSFSSVFSSQNRGKFYKFDTVIFEGYGKDARPSGEKPIGIFLGTIFHVEKAIYNGVEYSKVSYLTASYSDGINSFTCKKTIDELIELINS